MVSANVLFFLRVGGLRVLTTMGWDTRPHRSDEKGRWVYGLDHNGDRGKVMGLKNKLPYRLTANCFSWPGIGQPCVFAAFGYGAEGSWWAEPHTLPFSPTHPYGRKEQRPHRHKNRQVKQAG
jgi:hypothetical protein